MITQAELKEVIHYDSETGVFTWIKDRGPQKIAGKVAGCFARGYINIKLHNRTCKAHRLAWLYVTGTWPRGLIDHKDMNGLNNIFSNLREASNSQNQCNRGLPRSNTTGFKGVCKGWYGKYVARTQFEGASIHLGCFDTAEEASEAYQAFAKQAHGEFFNAG